ncbi:nuclear transport factor 2 (NTF2) superfamily protein [Rhodoblastus acidophilus]|nr:nuclear transport factor 2 (NTF2) superfamily protein [Rhodoblastus acidophilus]
MTRPPLPPFDLATATQKVRLAEDARNARDPARVAPAYALDSRWRNRVEFLQGRDAIEAFLTRKWEKEQDYRLIKEIWGFEATASPCASPMNGVMAREPGSAPMAMKIGNLTRTG